MNRAFEDSLLEFCLNGEKAVRVQFCPPLQTGSMVNATFQASRKLREALPLGARCVTYVISRDVTREYRSDAHAS
jgi:hypothetical protein